MISPSLPSFLTDKAHRYTSQSVTTNTATTYRAALNILGPASAWLGKPIEVPFLDSDCVALIVYIAGERSLRSTKKVYFAAYRTLHMLKAVQQTGTKN